jgi:hypothetical protein
MKVGCCVMCNLLTQKIGSKKTHVNCHVISSAAKPDPFFQVEPDFGPKIWVELGRVGPQGKKPGPIGSGWPQIGFKFGFNPIMYLINLNEPDFGSGLAPRVQIRVESGRVGPPGSKFGLIRVRLVGFIWPHYWVQYRACLKLKTNQLLICIYHNTYTSYIHWLGLN